MTYRVSIRERLKRMEDKAKPRKSVMFMATIVDGKYKVFESVSQRYIGSFSEQSFNSLA